MGNNVCTDAVPFTVSDLQFAPEERLSSNSNNNNNSLLTTENLISADVLNSFQGYDHNLKALRFFYKENPSQQDNGKTNRRGGGGGGSETRGSAARNRAAGSSGYAGSVPAEFSGMHLSPSNAVAAEHVGVEPVHLSAAQVPVHADDLYLLIHIERSGGSGPSLSRGPSPREHQEPTTRANATAMAASGSGGGEASSGAFSDSVNAPPWARGMAEVFTPRGLSTTVGRSTPRTSLGSTPRWSARRTLATAEPGTTASSTTPTAVGSGTPGLLEPSPQLAASSVHQLQSQQASQYGWYGRGGAYGSAAQQNNYQYSFTIHQLTGKTAHPLVAAVSVLYGFQLNRQLKEHPEQVKHLFYNINRSRLTSTERGGSRTSRRDRALLTITRPCLVGRLAWPSFVGNPVSLPAQRLNEACRRNALLRHIHPGAAGSATTFSPRAVSTSGTSVSSTSASPRSGGRVLGAGRATRGATVPSSTAFANRSATTTPSFTVPLANFHGSGQQGTSQQGPPTLELPAAPSDEPILATRRTPQTRLSVEGSASGRRHHDPVNSTTTTSFNAVNGLGSGTGTGADRRSDVGWPTHRVPADDDDVARSPIEHNESDDAASLVDSCSQISGEGVRQHSSTLTATPSWQHDRGSQRGRCFTTSADDEDTHEANSRTMSPLGGGGEGSGDGAAHSPTMLTATAMPSKSSVSSSHPNVPSLNLSRALAATVTPSRSAAPTTAPSPSNLALSSSGAAPVIPIKGFAALREKQLADLPRASKPEHGDTSGAWRGPEGAYRDYDVAEEGLDETDERRMSEDRVKRLRQVAPYATQVLPWLFVGGEAAAKDRTQLLHKGITAVVNTVAFSVPNYFPDCFRYLSLNLQDTPDEPIFSLFPYVNAFIEEVRVAGGRVFIHCHQGVSRSCSFAIAYIMWRNGLCYHAAYDLVRSKRLVCSPNSGFFVNLTCWECQLTHPTFNVAFVFVPHSKSEMFPFSFRQAFVFRLAGSTRGEEASRDFDVVHQLARVVTSHHVSEPQSSLPNTQKKKRKQLTGSCEGGKDTTEVVLDERLCYGFIMNFQSTPDVQSAELHSLFLAGTKCPPAIASCASTQWNAFIHYNYFRGYVPLSYSTVSTPKVSEDQHSTSTTTTATNATPSATVDGASSYSVTPRPLTPIAVTVDISTSVNQRGMEIVYVPVPALVSREDGDVADVAHSPRDVDTYLQMWLESQKRQGRPSTPRSGVAAPSSPALPRCVSGTDPICGELVDVHGGIDAVQNAFVQHASQVSSQAVAQPFLPSADDTFSTELPHAWQRPATAPMRGKAAVGAPHEFRHGRLGAAAAAGGGGGGGSGAGFSTPRAGGVTSQPAGHSKRRRSSGTAALGEGLVSSPPAAQRSGHAQPQPQTPPTANRSFPRGVASATPNPNTSHMSTSAGVPPASGSAAHDTQGARAREGQFRVTLPPAQRAPQPPAQRRGSGVTAPQKDSTTETVSGMTMPIAAAFPGSDHAHDEEEEDPSPRDLAPAAFDAAGGVGGAELRDVEVYVYPFDTHSQDDVFDLEDLSPERCYAIVVPGVGDAPILVFLWFGEECEQDREDTRDTFLRAFATPETRDATHPTLILPPHRIFENVTVSVVESSNEPDELLSVF